jgi:hypothetical protein
MKLLYVVLCLCALAVGVRGETLTINYKDIPHDFQDQTACDSVSENHVVSDTGRDWDSRISCDSSPSIPPYDKLIPVWLTPEDYATLRLVLRWHRWHAADTSWGYWVRGDKNGWSTLESTIHIDTLPDSVCTHGRAK